MSNADLPQDRKQPVKKALLQLEHLTSTVVGKAFHRRTEERLIDQGLSIAYANLIWHSWYEVRAPHSA